MLSLVFEREDLARVRLAGGADPMSELVLGLEMAQTGSVPAPFVKWRREISRRVARGELDSLRLLRGLVRANGSFPDFLTPAQLVSDIDEDGDVRLLAGADHSSAGDTARAIRTGYDALVGPYWTEVKGVVAHERSRRARELADQGVGQLLGRLPGVLSWDGRVLRTGYPVDRTVHLGGRGLVLLPSYFCWGNPVTWIDPDLPPVLVYQAHNTFVTDQPGPELSSHLVTLLGRTRAECLRLLVVPHTTTELADRLSISLGAASKQASVLRASGLVTSDRRGKTVVHNVTTLGIALLVGAFADR
jgi:DNA-binding transcriptional ArsR family regulator